MSATIHRLPVPHRPIPIAPVPEDDPATAMLKAIDRCEKKLGKRVTAIVIARRFQIADTIANTFNWRERAAVWKKDQK
jgi:hypothetical protein